jgi:surfactin family lipopeptide synthetase A
MYTYYGFDATDVILQKTTFTFDVSVWELFMPLCWGTKMVLCRREDIVSPERILSLIARHGVTCLHFVPGMLNAFIVALSVIDDIGTPLRSLRRVITSGEALAPATVKSWYKRSDVPVHNLYGPTEASVDVTYYATSANDNIVPIGKPIWNTQLYITGSHGELVPAGVMGEINIAGDGLARGYLNNEKLTTEKFVSNPFTPGKKMYKTGDQGRWLADGNIEFIGRKDDQVKIRGYRIELGEIETILLEHEAIDAATVITRAGSQGDKELIAYIVSSEVMNVPALRTYLGSRLPSYMVPAQFVQIAAMPLTASGKVDRKQLPDAQGTAMSAAVDYVAPTNEIEEQLVTVYQEVLRRELVGMRDDFFALGGDSIKSIQVTSRLKQQGYFVTIQDILLHPVVENLAKYVTTKPETTQELEEAVITEETEGFTYKGLSAEQLQKLNQML